MKSNAKILPALDDEFAKDVSEFDTLEEYKARSWLSKLKERKEKEAEQAREAAVVEKAAAAAEVEIPEAMVDTEIDYMMKDFENRLRIARDEHGTVLPILRSKRSRASRTNAVQMQKNAFATT